MNRQSATPKEAKMLRAIYDCDFHDGCDPIMAYQWSDVICEPFGPSADGLVSSLQKKRLAFQDGVKREACLAITLEGYAAMIEAEADPRLYQILDADGHPLGAWTALEMLEANPDDAAAREAVNLLRKGYEAEVMMGGGASPATKLILAPAADTTDGSKP